MRTFIFPRNAHKVVEMKDEMRFHCESIQMRLTERLKVFGFTYATQVWLKNIKETIVLNLLDFSQSDHDKTSSRVAMFSEMEIEIGSR